MRPDAVFKCPRLGDVIFITTVIIPKHNNNEDDDVGRVVLALMRIMTDETAAAVPATAAAAAATNTTMMNTMRWPPARFEKTEQLLRATARGIIRDRQVSSCPTPCRRRHRRCYRPRLFAVVESRVEERFLVVDGGATAHTVWDKEVMVAVLRALVLV
jgi:hypothetical protein